MTFPDITAAMVAWLDPLRTEPVYVDVPTDRPDVFTQLRRIGGQATPPVVDRPNVDVICWHTSAAQAMANLLEIRALVWALSGSTTLGFAVYNVAEMMGPRHDNDTEAGQAMAIFTASLAIRSDSAINQLG